MAIDDFNSAPPATGVTVDTLPDRWRTLISIRAAAFACAALAMNWIVDDMSVKGDELIKVRDENDMEYELSIEELFLIVYGDKLKAVDEEIKAHIEEFKNDI
jgi:hypothetical protein